MEKPMYFKAVPVSEKPTKTGTIVTLRENGDIEQRFYEVDNPRFPHWITHWLKPIEVEGLPSDEMFSNWMAQKRKIEEPDSWDVFEWALNQCQLQISTLQDQIKEKDEEIERLSQESNGNRLEADRWMVLYQTEFKERQKESSLYQSELISEKSKQLILENENQSLKELLGDVKANHEQYGYLTEDILKRL
jgi:predicted ATP-dependent protease